MFRNVLSVMLSVLCFANILKKQLLYHLYFKLWHLSEKATSQVGGYVTCLSPTWLMLSAASQQSIGRRSKDLIIILVLATVSSSTTQGKTTHRDSWHYKRFAQTVDYLDNCFKNFCYISFRHPRTMRITLESGEEGSEMRGGSWSLKILTVKLH